MPLGGAAGYGIPVTGIWKKIVDVKLSAAATSIDITGLDLSSHKIYMIEVYLYNPTVGNTNVAYTFNGDSTSNHYRRQYMISYNGANHQGDGANDYYLSTVQAGKYMFYTGFLSQITNPRSVFCQGGTNDTATSGNISCVRESSTDNVTQITLTASVADSIGIGSFVRIFKIEG